MSGEFLDYRGVLRQVLAAMALRASVQLSGPGCLDRIRAELSENPLAPEYDANTRTGELFT